MESSLEQNNNLTRSKIEFYKNESLSEQSVQSEPPKSKKRVRKMKKKQEEESEDYEESEESKDSEEFKLSLARTTEKEAKNQQKQNGSKVSKRKPTK